jgi:Domain of unknown function (DUF6378)
MTRAEILDRAKALITTDRAATHGDALASFTLVAALWSAATGRPFTALDVSMMMELFKMARFLANPGHADNSDDKVGYAAISGELAAAGHRFSEVASQDNTGAGA